MMLNYLCKLHPLPGLGFFPKLHIPIHDLELFPKTTCYIPVHLFVSYSLKLHIPIHLFAAYKRCKAIFENYNLLTGLVHLYATYVVFSVLSDNLCLSMSLQLNKNMELILQGGPRLKEQKMNKRQAGQRQRTNGFLVCFCFPLFLFSFSSRLTFVGQSMA